MQLRQAEDSDEGRCVECQVRRAVGPCAACHGMVCGDCCTLTTDPRGKAVICLSCTRMVATVRKSDLQRRPAGSKATALIVLAVLAVGLVSLVLR